MKSVPPILVAVTVLSACGEADPPPEVLKLYDYCAQGLEHACADGEVCVISELRCRRTCEPEDDPCDEPNDLCAPHGDAGFHVCQLAESVNCVRDEDCAAFASPCGVAECVNNLCKQQPKPDGERCEDGDPCTEVSQCSGGLCVVVTEKDCGKADACNRAYCDPSTGGCRQRPVVDGTPCDNGDYCTVADRCDRGACVAGRLRRCPAPGACEIGACDSRRRTCVARPAERDLRCDDGVDCTSGDACDGAGRCLGEVSEDACDDEDPGTTDVCTPRGCRHTED